MIIRLIKRIFRKYLRFVIGSRRSKAGTWLLTYVLALFPANYITTGLTTAANLTQPAQVIQVMKNTEALSSVYGVLNTATGGVLKPVLNGGLAAAGSITQAVGKTFDIDGLTTTGEEWIEKANEWFSAGKAAINGDNLSSTTQDVTSTSLAPGGQPVDYAWNESLSGYYKVLGKAVTAEQTVYEAGEFKYSDLDELGRSGIAEAIITIKDIERSAGTRDKFEKGSEPSGWGHNPKVAVKMTNGKTYHGYAWNRSHLIADSLGGRAYRNNLITGTRMQNVGANDLHGGMQYIERKVLDYVKAHPSRTVWYRVTPIYEKDELVPRVVLVDALSDTGDINERVETYNVLPGYKIDYMTGKISK